MAAVVRRWVASVRMFWRNIRAALGWPVRVEAHDVASDDPFLAINALMRMAVKWNEGQLPAEPVVFTPERYARAIDEDAYGESDKATLTWGGLIDYLRSQSGSYECLFDFLAIGKPRARVTIEVTDDDRIRVTFVEIGKMTRFSPGGYLAARPKK